LIKENNFNNFGSLNGSNISNTEFRKYYVLEAYPTSNYGTCAQF